MGRILIDIDGDQVTVHRPDDTGAPEDVLRRAAEIGALSAGAAPPPPGRARLTEPARALFDAGRGPARGTKKSRSSRPNPPKGAARTVRRRRTG